MGRVDWKSPQFRYLEHLCENPEPPGYARHFFEDRRQAIGWLVSLYRGELISIVNKDDLRLSGLGIEEIARAVQNDDNSGVVILSEQCRLALSTQSEDFFQAAIAEQASLSRAIVLPE